MANLGFDDAEATVASASALVRILTFEAAANPSLSALDLMETDARQAEPALSLTAVRNGALTTWTPLPDLLASGPGDRSFVAEIDTDGFARLRFGDGVNGMSPDAGTAFTATFRVGNGAAGNVGPESLIHFAGDPRILSCANPMAAAGGVDPETAAQIRRRAPAAFETQERAVTMTDYANAVAGASSQVAGAAATLRWTGSWHTAFVAAEPKGGGALRKPLRKTIAAVLDRYRLAGQDFKLESPDYVPLDIVLDICVEDGFFQRDVEKAVTVRLTRGDPSSGQAPLFAPGSFALGETVYLSPITTAVRSVAGVCSVGASVFQPQGIATTNLSAERRDSDGRVPGGAPRQRPQLSQSRPVAARDGGRKVRRTMTCTGASDCTCGCCAGVAVETPRGEDNRAGLSAIAYRTGVWATFKNSMLARLSSADYPALAEPQDARRRRLQHRRFSTPAR